MKKFFLAIMLICISLAAVTVSASSFINHDQDCTIIINTKEEILDGEIIEIYKVGEIDRESESLSFILAEEFKRMEVDLNRYEKVRESEKEELCDLLVNACDEATPVGRTFLDAKGQATFVVKPGMYLIQSLTMRKVKIQPALIGVPNMNSDGDGWEYSITVEPKVFSIENTDAPETGDVLLKDIIRISIILFLTAIIFIIVTILRIKSQKRKYEKSR